MAEHHHASPLAGRPPAPDRASGVPAPASNVPGGAWFQALVEAAPDAIVGVDAHGIILFVNGRAESLFGYSAQEAVGRPIALAVPPDQAEQFQGYVASALQGSESEGLETVFRRNDGSLVHVAVTVSPLRDRSGSVTAVSVIARDMTERKLAQMALKESEERYRRIVETTQDGVWAADEANRTSFVNARVKEMLGYSAAEMLGAPLEQFVAAEDRPLLASHLDRRRKGVREQYDLRLRRKDGADVWVIVSAAPLGRAEGPYAGMLAMLTDITARKEAEADLARSNDDLEAFSFSVSHDLRAPLRSLQGFSKALLEDYSSVLDSTGKDYARRITAAAARMDAMVSDLLEYSRLTRAKLELGPVDLDSEVRSVLSQVADDPRKKEAKVEVEWPLPKVMGEKQALRRILSNLISNASKFVAPGVKPAVRVWSEPRDGWVREWVEDNGIGLAPGDQERIWRVFERLHGDDAYPGTGIGLSIVRRGAEGIGGRAGVESSPGHGSRFWVDLRAVG